MSGIEVLRILSMMAIIVLHIYDYGGLDQFLPRHGGVTQTVGMLAWSFCRAPVDVFILITGYFLANQPTDLRKTAKRAREVYAPMLFYSLLITAVFLCANPACFLGKPEMIVSAFFPFFSRTWYFLTLYLLLLAISPFLGRVLQELDKRSYLALLVFLFVVMSLWPTLAETDPVGKVVSVKKIVSLSLGKSFGSFLLYYVLGGYLRRFTTPYEKPRFRYLAIFILLCLLDFGLDQLFADTPETYHTVYGAFNNPLVVAEAASIFLFFRDWHFSSRVINAIAGTTIGVYAIHEHPLMRKWLWEELAFPAEAYAQNKAVLLLIPATVIGIFAVCGGVDALRQWLFNRVRHLFQKKA